MKRKIQPCHELFLKSDDFGFFQRTIRAPYLYTLRVSLFQTCVFLGQISSIANEVIRTILHLFIFFSRKILQHKKTPQNSKLFVLHFFFILQNFSLKKINKWKVVLIISFAILLRCTNPQPPIKNLFLPNLAPIFFFITLIYFHLCALIFICKNFLLFIIVCENLFLFMIVCENLFFVVARISSYL